AARNRRASVIREVSQAESEQVTTRVIANYNHMHALSVSYYEVVQIYRVSVQLADIDRCLFVPFLVIDFTDANIVRRFRLVLAAAALELSLREVLLTDPDLVVVEVTTDQASHGGDDGSAPDATECADVAA